MSTPITHYKLLRKIHPVGQGAFYSEQFYNNEVDKKPQFTVVYDCGGNRDKVTEEIKSITQVDILFISHFHADHICGVMELLDKKSVKRVVFPLISPCRFMVDYVRNSTKNGMEESCRLMLKLLPIVRSVRSGNVEHLTIEGTDYVPIKSDKRPHKYPSVSGLWEYLSFFKENDLKERGIWEKLADKLILQKEYAERYQDESVYQGISDRLKKDKDLLKETKKIFDVAFQGDHNSYSMVVLSHEVKDENFTDKSRHFDCLYTGDINVSNETWVVTEVLNQYNPDYIQVPHHGSNHNHDDRLYRNDRIAFMSVGEKNRYRHPGLKSLLYIYDTSKEIHVVTENRSFSRLVDL